MSRRLDLPKPSLSIGYITEHPDDIQYVLEQLTLQEKEEEEKSEVSLNMDRDMTPGLTDSNFGRWKIKFMDVLMAHKLDKVANGQLPRPINRNTPEEDEWKYKDAQARVLIRRSLPEDAFQHT